MRRQALSTIPPPKDVCIFCTTRLQFASSQPTTSLQRRFLRSTTSLRRPPAVGVAKQEDAQKQDTGTAAWRSEPSRKQSWNSWAPSTTPRDLTHEERELRNALQNVPQPQSIERAAGRENDRWAQAQKGQDPEGNARSSLLSQQSIQRGDDLAPGVDSMNGSSKLQGPFRKNTANPAIRSGNTGAQIARQQSSGNLFRKHSVVDNKHAGAEFDKAASKASPLSREEDAEALRAQGWKHVRRRVPPIDVQHEHKQHQRTRNANLPAEDPNFVRIRAAEEERMARLEKTRDGRFVGLRRGPTIENSMTTRSHGSPNKAETESVSVNSKEQDGWTHWKPSQPSPANFERSGVTDEASLGVSSGEPKSRPSTIRSHLSFDPEFEEERRPKGVRMTERNNTSERRAGPRGSGIEITSAPRGRGRQSERRSKKFVTAIDEDIDDDDDSRAERKMERKKLREKAKAAQKAAAAAIPIHLPEFISVSNLAGVLKVRVEDFMYKMKDLGFEETSNDHVLDAETAGLVAAEFNYEPVIQRAKDHDLLSLPPAEDKSVLPPRPPVVTIMGHVDHGKTTLLDYLRKSSVAASEHGGITQHIGAFSVPMPGGRLVTFLDTPGHEAFLSMRQRGANVTDIVILVVAADDSVKPQTVEAIKHAQAARVPMIVAVNKIDKEDSDVQRVKQDLARYGVEIEDFGGDTQVVCVSGKTGQGMDELEDAAVALADILDMRSEVGGQAEGWVLEATTKKAGRVATVLVRRGTLRSSDIIVAGTSWARIRSLRNEAGTMVPSAGPGTPVEIDGWREQPSAGDEVIQAPSEQKAKSVIAYRLEATERTKLAADIEAVNESRRLEQLKRSKESEAAILAEANPDAPPPVQEPPPPTAPPSQQEIHFILKADVSGSLEAIQNAISSLGTPEIRPHILRSGVGSITEFDIDHAAVAQGQIINFNTPIDGPIYRVAESKGVDIIDQSIIYRLVDDVKAKLGEKLAPRVTTRVVGEAEIAQVFEINTKGRVTIPVAGCKVRNGIINRGAKVRVVRNKETVFDGELSSLKNVKKDVVEMRKGNECGMGFEGWTEFRVGDQVQAYEEAVEKRSL